MGESFYSSVISSIDIYLQNRGYQIFCCKNFCLSLLKKFSGEPIKVSGCFAYRKILCTRGSISRVSLETLLSYFARKFLGEPYSVSLISDIPKNFMHMRGAITFFCRKFLVSECREFPMGSFLCSTTCGFQRVLCTRVVRHAFLSICFLTLTRQFSGNPSLLRKVLGIEYFYSWGGISQISVEVCLSHSTK